MFDMSRRGFLSGLAASASGLWIPKPVWTDHQRWDAIPDNHGAVALTMGTKVVAAKLFEFSVVPVGPDPGPYEWDTRDVNLVTQDIVFSVREYGKDDQCTNPDTGRKLRGIQFDAVRVFIPTPMKNIQRICSVGEQSAFGWDGKAVVEWPGGVVARLT